MKDYFSKMHIMPENKYILFVPLSCIFVKLSLFGFESHAAQIRQALPDLRRWRETQPEDSNQASSQSCLVQKETITLALYGKN